MSESERRLQHPARQFTYKWDSEVWRREGTCLGVRLWPHELGRCLLSPWGRRGWGSAAMGMGILGRTMGARGWGWRRCWRGRAGAGGGVWRGAGMSLAEQLAEMGWPRVFLPSRLPLWKIWGRAE